jgi:branched-chain amino acid transport system permease protein
VGATLITIALFGFATAGQAVMGRAVIALMLIVAVLCLPEGIIPAWLRRRRLAAAKAAGHAAAREEAPASTVPPAAPAARIDTPANPAVAARDAGRIVLDIDNVRKSFGGLQALRGANLDVREGEILGLIGPNGCGKTTLINMITGHLSLTSGSIRLDGDLISGLPAHRIAGRGIARTYQIPRPFAHLSTLENVEMCALFGGRAAASAREESLHWLEFCGLSRRADALPAELNLRERKVLELARALAARPRVLLLDEVMSGLNPAEVDTAIRLVRQIRDQGTTIVFVEHLMRAVVQLSDRVAVMNEGALLTSGSPEEVMRDERVKNVYFGNAHAA